MRPLSAQELDAIIAGCVGVTPGPWYTTGSPWFSSSDGVLAGSEDGNIAYLLADCDDAFNPRDEYTGPFELGDKYRDAAHIARCSPEVIRALCEDWLRMRAPPSDTSGEAVAVEASNMRDTHDQIEPVGYLFELRYGGSRWSSGPMYDTVLPRDPADYRNVEPLYPASALAAAEARGVQIGLEQAAKVADTRSAELRANEADLISRQKWDMRAIITSKAEDMEAISHAIRALSPAHKGSENV